MKYVFKPPFHHGYVGGKIYLPGDHVLKASALSQAHGQGLQSFMCSAPVRTRLIYWWAMWTGLIIPRVRAIALSISQSPGQGMRAWGHVLHMCCPHLNMPAMLVSSVSQLNHLNSAQHDIPG